MDADTGKKKPGIKPEIRDIMCVAYRPDGKTLAIADKRSSIHLLDTNTHTVKTHFRHPQIFVGCLAYSPDGKKLAAGYSQGMVNILDATTGAVLQTFSGDRNMIVQVEFASYGTTLASLDVQGQLLLWKME